MPPVLSNLKGLVNVLELEELGSASLCGKRKGVAAKLIANNLHQAFRSPILRSGD
jgi:hypothetical protein